jgi:hypothetical protein
VAAGTDPEGVVMALDPDRQAAATIANRVTVSNIRDKPFVLKATPFSLAPGYKARESRQSPGRRSLEVRALPAAPHGDPANNSPETPRALNAPLRPMPWVKRDRTARVIVARHASVTSSP